MQNQWYRGCCCQRWIWPSRTHQKLLKWWNQQVEIQQTGKSEPVIPCTRADVGCKAKRVITKQTNNNFKKINEDCSHCGGKHMSSECWFRQKMCRMCGLKSYIVRACRNKYKVEQTKWKKEIKQRCSKDLMISTI